MKLCVIFLGLMQIKRILASFELEDLIPKEYDRLVPPKTNENEPVNVTVAMFVIQIRSVDEEEMDFKMDILLRQTWQDNRLKFPENMGNKKLVLDPKWRDYIWTPDVWFKNALDTKLQQWEVPSVFYWLENNKVCFSGRVTLELSCDMEMHNYPHDTQRCGVDIMALMNPSDDLQLEWKEQEPIRVSKIMRLPQFDVDETFLDRCDNYMYGEMYSCIRASFSLVRRGGYFMINTYIPTILIVMMSMLTFWIPQQAVPARITLGVTSLLTIITKQYQSSMPNVSYIVALNIWLSSCVAFVFCSLLEYAVVITLEKRHKNKIQPLTTVSNNEDGENSKSTENKSPVSFLKAAWKAKTLTIIDKMSAETVDYVSRIMFPCLFGFFVIVYTCKYS